MSNSRKNIIIRSYIVAFVFLALAIAVAVKLMQVQVNEQKKYQNFAMENNFRTKTIKGERGNLYSADGILLATTITEHHIYWDVHTVKKELFESELGALCDSLAHMTDESAGFYEQKFRRARKEKKRYVRVLRNLNFDAYNRVKEFPIFREGQNKGGFIHETQSKRKLATGDVGRRTLGYDRDSIKAGLEGAYSHLLSGTEGRRVERLLGRGYWRPIDEWIKVPRDGADVFTTIDAELQNTVYYALNKQLRNYQAVKGCAIVMEVATGKIRAMVNLAQVADGSYQDIQNYAVWESAEPGSTIKPMHVLAGLADEKFNENTVVETGNGRYRIGDRTISDSHANGSISVGEVIEESSNVGMVKLISGAYRSEPDKLTQHFTRWGLDRPQKIDIPGEGIPEIPNPENAKWSHQTLASFAFGYETKLTPLQILSFYNGLANNGTLLKPLFLEKIVRKGEEILYQPEVITSEMADSASLLAVRNMLEKVVQSGTAKNIKSEQYSIAGKTGTAKVEYWIKNRRTQYRASFAGYFPADKPKYSCYVMIYKPNRDKGFYGSQVAAPVFREIADKVFASTPKKVKVVPKKEKEQHVEFTLKSRNHLPKLTNLPASQVIPELENWGLDVRYQGYGKVVKQSIPANTGFRKGQTIYLTLQP